MAASSEIAFRRSIGAAGLAAVLFILLFSFYSTGLFDFWWWMSFNILVLCGLGFIMDRKYIARLAADIKKSGLKKIILGLLSAFLLYGVFFIGESLAGILPAFAREGIEGVYAFKEGVPVIRMVLLMALIIGPGEEIFWRGYLQQTWQMRLGKTGGWLICTALYTLIHVPSGNVVLVAAALTAGLFWGGLYHLTRSAILVAVSHTAWDILVFILLPF